MEPQHKRGEAGENNRDHLRSSASQQYEVASRIIVYLAESPTPGRIVIIHWVAEGSKLQLLEKLTGISYKDFQDRSFLRKMFTRQGRQCSSVLKQIDNLKITAVEYALMKLKALNHEGTSV